MKTRHLQHTLTITVLALVAAGMMVLAGCSKKAEAQAPAAPPASPVSVAAVVSRNVVEHQEFSGRIEAVESAEIRARVRGTIEAVHFKPGSMVKKGDLLFVIDPRAYEAEALRSEAALQASQAKADLARTELDRSSRLLADNAIAQRDFDERAAAARQLEAAARADKAALATARLNLGYTTVRAPFSGRVGKAEVTVGNLVDSNVVLTSLVSVQPVYVSFDGDEATFLSLGSAARGGAAAVKVRMGLSNETGFPHEGRLDFVDNRIDPGSSSVRMRALVDNKDNALTPGLFARVQIGAAPSPSLLINDSAVGTDQNRKYVYVVGAGNKAEYRVVQLGPVIDGLRLARSGLKAGERIVVAGLQRVRPGAVVAPTEVPMLPPASAPASATVAKAQ
jgi:multidrug efflux system membrane fusion protein